MDRHKYIILLAVFLVTVSAVMCGLAISIAAGLSFSYQFRQSFQTPVIRHFWLLIILLVSVEIWCLFYAYLELKTKKSIAPFFKMMGVIVGIFCIYFLGSLYRTDIPYSFYMQGDRYEVPWDFQPDGNSNGQHSYLRIHANYPQFQPVRLIEEGAGLGKYRLRVSRQTSPDMLCFGDIGCLSVIGVPRSEQPVSQQLKATVRKHLSPSNDASDFQKTELHGPDESVLYFYKVGSIAAQDTYGICKRSSLFVTCDYLFSDGNFFYNIHLDSNKFVFRNDWVIDRDVPLISNGVIKIFDSLRK